MSFLTIATVLFLASQNTKSEHSYAHHSFTNKLPIRFSYYNQLEHFYQFIYGKKREVLDIYQHY